MDRLQDLKNTDIHKIMIEFHQLILLDLALFLCGIWGMLAAPANIITILISLELLLLSASLSFLSFSIYLDNDIVGQIFALFILSTAGAESAIGLACMLTYYRFRGEITLTSLTNLKA